MRTPTEISSSLSDGFHAIRLANRIEEDSDNLRALALQASSVELDSSVPRRDATALPMVTLDPASSTDLDQAFSLHKDEDEIVISYAIADIGAFVARGSALEEQAWLQGVTVYSPDGSVPLYPRLLSSHRASLLPDGPRPAILHTVSVNTLGEARLLKVERAWVQSRAKLAYDAVSEAQLPEHLAELSRRVHAAELSRGAFRVERQEQEVVRDADTSLGWTLRFAQRKPSEDHNAALSLATNLAVANFFLQHRCGLYRVMDEPNEHELVGLRTQAKSLGIPWPAGETLHQVVARLDQAQPDHAAFALAMRRTGGGARYELFCASEQTRGPWHAAIAAPYAHATAPMRRLADRYVLDLLVALHEDDQQSVDELQTVLQRLPEVMEIAERRAAKIDRECIELVEARLLQEHIGSVLSAKVTEIVKDAVLVQLESPAITWRVRLPAGQRLSSGETVALRVVALAEPDKGRRTVPLMVDLQLT